MHRQGVEKTRADERWDRAEDAKEEGDVFILGGKPRKYDKGQELDGGGWAGGYERCLQRREAKPGDDLAGELWPCEIQV